MTWPLYIENRTIVRRVIMRLNCTYQLAVLEKKAFLLLFIHFLFLENSVFVGTVSKRKKILT